MASTWWPRFRAESAGSCSRQKRACNLYPTRIPYEESSVFSLVDLASPDLVRFPRFKNSRPIVITLEAGQVLYVPRHWWHYVTCTETAVSINTWVEVPEDRESRVQESVTRLLASSLIPYLSHAVGSDVEDFWVNPTEELEEAGCNVQYLKVALTSVTTSLTAAVDATPPDQDHQPQSDHKRCSPVPKNPEGSTDEEKKGQTIEETCGQMGGGTERQINKEAIGEIIEKAEGQRSRQTITQTAACFGATEISSVPCQSPGEATNTPNTLRTKQNDVESQMTADPKKREKNVDGVSSLLNHVARALKDATVYTVDSPFSLSASQARPLQTVSLPCPRGHGDSVQETETQDRSAVSLKRKCVDSENEDTGETQGDKASRFQSMSSSKLYKAVDGTDVHGQKRMCRREKKESTSVSSVSQCFVETEESEAQVCSEPPQTPGSLISVYAPQPCHLQQYIRLLQEGDSTVSSELGTEKDEKEENDGERDEEVENSDERDRREENDDEKDEKENEDKEDELSNSSCLASDSSMCHPAPAVEEAVLRSVLHPDVVTLIVSKLKEQVG
ncbi:uncharacterized protein LOC143290165 isoform X2 [Babylonia areolata]|uniref:uncharacterized protein LOC143290165 isoform X2 n=1 Tax=Babylonia areolata TaxID=304850 RepID=UPI003FD026C7